MKPIPYVHGPEGRLGKRTSGLSCHNQLIDYKERNKNWPKVGATSHGAVLRAPTPVISLQQWEVVGNLERQEVK